MQQLQIGRISLSESEIRSISEKPGDSFYRTIDIEGIETTSNNSIANLRSKQANIVNSYGQMVPVVFGNKTDWNGYYAVGTAEATLTEWTSQSAAVVEWKFTLDLVGMANDMDLESRLGGATTLANDFSTAGERWHAPAGGHSAYWSGDAQPVQVTRTGSDGLIKVYRDIDPEINPRWNCPTTSYGLGRARFVDNSMVERAGTSMSLDPVGWSLHNSLMKVTGVAGKLEIASHNGTNWQAKNWDIRYNNVGLGTPTTVSVSRNDYDSVQIRLLWNLSPSGRVTADLTLRRGARYVEVLVKSMLSAKLGVHPSSAIASTVVGGTVTATANDSQGNRYTAGATRTFVGDTTSGGLSISATLALDAYIGSVVGGGSAVDGDQADDLFEQFLGAPSERVIGVRL